MKKSRRRIVIDICHPAEVHHFKYVYRELTARGWTILFAAKRKDVVEALLCAYDLPHVLFSESKKGLVKKVLHVPVELWRFGKIVRRFRPTFIFSTLSIHSSWIAFLFRITHIAFIDTEHRRVLDYATLPFADVKVTPRAYQRRLGARQIRYNGNHEVAYLHPLWCTPDPSVKALLGVKSDEKYVILRFVGWHAFHDAGLSGLSLAKKLQLVERLSRERRVFISSEAGLPEPLKRYALNIPVERVHDALAFADAYIGEGGTMASEAACLGTPAVYLNALRLGYVDEEEHFGLLHHYTDLTDDVWRRILSISKEQSGKKNVERFWRRQIDVTGFIVDFITRYPHSLLRQECGAGCSAESGSRDRAGKENSENTVD